MADGDLSRRCTVAGCTKAHRARGYCSAHWLKWRRYGDPLGGVALGPLPERCAAPGCAKAPHSRWKGGNAYCNKHYLRMLFHGDLELHPAPPAPLIGHCIVEGCTSFRRSGRAKLCEAHYYRRRRTGRLDLAQPQPQKTSGGYVLLKAPNHPLAIKNGWVAQHRQVAYDACGGTCPCCHWCGKQVSWRSCHVDHLNGVKDDNRVENLVVTCAQCNRSRGAAWPFLLGLTDAALAQLVEMVGADRRGR